MSRKTSASTGGLQTHKDWLKLIHDAWQTPLTKGSPHHPPPPPPPRCRTMFMECTACIAAYCRCFSCTSRAMHMQEVTSDSMCGQCKVQGSSPAVDGLP